uniref:Glycosyltransferase RgtA/B/C/D-like domain-containing protein n=1 Tax=Solibacter usitatus (strain Ellin6076) TaxID=234267 RepID=Q01VF4_SOLUE
MTWPGQKRALTVLYWIVPSLLCLALHWRAFDSWFRADDFAWLGLGLNVTDFRSLLHALFAPSPHGTVRPLSERAFFLITYRFFGLDPLLFRVVAFATQFANLALVAAIGARITGVRAAGFWAAMLWAINSALFVPLVWACAYCEPLCGLCMLLAFYFLLRYIETGGRRFQVAQWVVFLLGFGALELMVVYPAVAAAYAWLCARRHFARTLWLFAGSAAYFVVHTIFVPPQKAGLYAMHLTGAVFRTFGIYWAWSLRPAAMRDPRWLALGAVWVLTIGLVCFAIGKLRAGSLLPLFCFAWYLIVISPLLLLRDHLGEYYVFLPVVGLCWLAGWALSEAKPAAIALAVLYACLAVPYTLRAEDRNWQLTARVRNLVEGVAGAHELHPKQAILLDGVDTDLFWNAILDRPFRLFGLTNVYLAPGSDRAITAYPDRGNIAGFIAPAYAVEGAIQRGELVVYDVRAPRLRNITSHYAAPRDRQLPRRIDAASPLTAALLGPEWYPADSGIRWMPQQATLRIGAPTQAGQKLYLHGISPAALTISVTAGGVSLPAAALSAPGNFEVAFDLPASAVGSPELKLALSVDRVTRPATDPRDFGLAFGIFEVR